MTFHTSNHVFNKDVSIKPIWKKGCGVVCLLLLLMLFAPSCGGDDDEAGEVGESGVDRSLLLSEMDASQKQAMCQWMAGRLSAITGDESCLEAAPTIPTVDDCMDATHDYPPCSVADYEDCIIAQSDDICASATASACEPYLTCSQSATPPQNADCNNGGSGVEMCIIVWM